MERPQGEQSTVSLDQLKRNVREDQNAGTANWWKSVNSLLDQISSADAAAFAKEIAEGKRQNLFNFAVQARAMEPEALKEATRKTGAPEAREAAVNEMQRRLEDPLVKFMVEHFSLRPELAMKFAAQLKKWKGDDAKTAKLLARLMGPLKREQREKLMKAASDSLNKPELDAQILDKIAQGANVSLGGQPDNAFKQAFKDAWGGVMDRNRQFDQLMSNALGGDKASRDELVKQFGRDAVLDYISSALRNGNDGRAVDLAKAVAREDKDGNLFLDLNPDNAALASDAKGESLFLGNKNSNESIRAALDAFDRSGGGSHDNGLSFDPGTRSRFQQFSLGDTPAEGSRRVFAAAGPDGNGSLTEIPAGSALPTSLATQPIKQTETLPEPKKLEVTPPKPEKPQESTPPPSSPDKLNDQQAKALIDAKCAKCHKDGEGNVLDAFHYSPEGLSNKATLKRIKAAMEKPVGRRMPRDDKKFPETEDGKKLLAWLAEKTK